nr:unnamed protein product [Callosobruchus chinensis]
MLEMSFLSLSLAMKRLGLEITYYALMQKDI